MTDGESLGEIRTVLAGVAERITRAYEEAAVARTRIADAAAVLTTLSEQQPGLPPPALGRAADELDRGLGLISGGAAVVAEIDGRL